MQFGRTSQGTVSAASRFLIYYKRNIYTVIFKINLIKSRILDRLGLALRVGLMYYGILFLIIK